jgi:hypothetical protein
MAVRRVVTIPPFGASRLRHRRRAEWFKAAVLESEALKSAGDVAEGDNTAVRR